MVTEAFEITQIKKPILRKSTKNLSFSVLQWYFINYKLVEFEAEL